MDRVFGILLVIIFLLIVLQPVLRRWVAPLVQRWVMGKVEDRVRRMAGMPTRKEERKAQRRAARGSRGAADRFRRAAAGSRAAGRTPGGREARSSVDMLQTFAEDVEFTEVKSYSSEVEIAASKEGRKVTYKVEQQVEDAEFIEIKTREKKAPDSKE